MMPVLLRTALYTHINEMDAWYDTYIDGKRVAQAYIDIGQDVVGFASYKCLVNGCYSCRCNYIAIDRSTNSINVRWISARQQKYRYAKFI